MEIAIAINNLSNTIAGCFFIGVVVVVALAIFIKLKW